MTTDNHRNRREHIKNFLVQMGDAVYRQKYRGYFDMKSLSEICEEHGICFEGRVLDRFELDNLLKSYVGGLEAVAFEGVSVFIWYRETDYDRQLLLRFDRYDKDLPITKRPCDLFTRTIMLTDVKEEDCSESTIQS